MSKRIGTKKGHSFHSEMIQDRNKNKNTKFAASQKIIEKHCRKSFISLVEKTIFQNSTIEVREHLSVKDNVPQNGMHKIKIASGFL